MKDENKPNVFCLTYAEKLGKIWKNPISGFLPKYVRGLNLWNLLSEPSCGLWTVVNPGVLSVITKFKQTFLVTNTSRSPEQEFAHHAVCVCYVAWRSVFSRSKNSTAFKQKKQKWAVSHMKALEWAFFHFFPISLPFWPERKIDKKSCEQFEINIMMQLICKSNQNQKCWIKLVWNGMYHARV